MNLADHGPELRAACKRTACHGHGSSRIATKILLIANWEGLAQLLLLALPARHIASLGAAPCPAISGTWPPASLLSIQKEGGCVAKGLCMCHVNGSALASRGVIGEVLLVVHRRVGVE
jgi:hypothetical protein